MKPYFLTLLTLLTCSIHAEPLTFIDDEACYGSTPASNTNWIQYTPNGLYVDVDISECGFSQVPHLIVSSHGDANIWQTTGGSSAYNRSTSSFRVYLSYKKSIKPREAKLWKWHVQWVARPAF